MFGISISICLESKYKTVCNVSLVFCTVVQAANKLIAQLSV